jgi:hypothetical protein
VAEKFFGEKSLLKRLTEKKTSMMRLKQNRKMQNEESLSALSVPRGYVAR